MKGKKSGIGKVVVLTTAGVVYLISGGTAKADPNMVDIWHYNASFPPTGELVDVKENSANVEYIDYIGDILRICGIGPLPEDPNDNKLCLIGINNGRTVSRLAFSVDQEIPNGTERFILINYFGSTHKPGYGPLNSNKRNIFMIQNPNDPNDSTPNPNKYDILDPTNYFEDYTTINLPTVTSSTPRDQVSANWYFITSNYADIHPKITNGIVNLADFAVFAASWRRSDANENNNWHKGADLDRNGDVNEIDLIKFAEQYLCDPNTISKAIDRILPRHKKLSYKRHKTVA